ncbi:MAG: hypothetical protein ACR2IT_08965 [Pirellulales bacterium]
MRRHLLMLAMVAIFACPTVTGRSEPPETVPGGVASLEDRLTTGLRVKAAGDVAFVKAVVQRVHEGQLPEKLVDSTYLWAVSRGRKYPFPAFQHVIRLQAEKLNVSLESVTRQE